MGQQISRLKLGNVRRVIIFVLAILLSNSMFSQSGIIKGIVVDEKGESIIGASVVVKGTVNGTITDIDGHFTINTSPKDVLQISYVGYKSQDVVVSTGFMKIVLHEDAEVLDEVVVVGFGTQKKVNLTGAVASIGADAFGSKGASNSPLSSLQGALAGVNVTRTSSSPSNSGWNFSIRGMVSVNQPSPLVIIDGIPGSIDAINADDIENISFLKDASAAIYGARAAGGVVLVTTKRGKTQKMRVTYKGSLTQHVPGLIMNYMNMKQYMTTFEEAYINDGKGFEEDLNIYPRWVVNAYKVQNVVSDENSPLYTGAFQGMNTWASYVLNDIHDYGFYDVNWNDVLWGNSLSKTHTISLNGGDERKTFNLSLGYVNDNSVLKWGEDYMDRYNFRLNNDFKVTDKLSLASNVSFDRTLKSYPQRRPNDVGGQPAGSPVSTDDGLPYAWGGQMGSQWLSKLGGQNNYALNSFTLNLSATLNIVKGLDFIARGSLSTNDSYKKWSENPIQWYYLDGSENMISPTTYKVGTYDLRSIYQNYTGYLNYIKRISNHNISAMGGFSFEKNKWGAQNITAINPSVTNVTIIEDADSYSIDETDGAYALESVYSRFNYDYKGKYLFEILGRYDGSSKFQAGYRWKGFYGFSGGYRLSEETFLKELDIFSNLKLRASYGTTGNQSGINDFDGLSFLSLSTASGVTPSQPLFGSDGSTYMISTLTEKQMVSTTRTWETITNSNVGLDFGLIKGKLNGTLEYFWRKNDNMLVALTYPSVLGISSPETNNGTFTNQGWEISLDWKDKIADFTYGIGLNLSDNNTMLVSMKNTSTITNGYNQYIEGQPYGTYWGYKSNGLITTADELAAYKAMGGSIIPANIRIGDMMYDDVNGDGSITTDDMIKLGEDLPHYSFGINMNAAWKGFDFALFFQGVGERTVMRTDYTRAPMLSWYKRQNAAWAGKQYSDIGESEYVVSNNLQAYYNTVQKSADLMPKLSANTTINAYNYLYSSAWFSKQDGKYIRLKNITLGYTLPKNIISKAKIENVRFYFTGTDVFEISGITDGWDPEASRDTYGGTNGSNAYPFTRNYTIGVDVTF